MGVGRSGTSLLQAMLASHSQVYFLPETSFLRRFVMTRSLETLPIESIKSMLLNDTRLQRLERPISPFTSETSDKTFIAKTIYESLFDTNESLEYFGDKDPRNVEYVLPILSMWPDSKLIHIYRDPRDVLASKKKAEWSKHNSLFFHLVAGAAQFALAQESKNTSSIYHIRYESLIVNQTDELGKLCDWLSIRFDSSMENFASEAKRLASKEEMQWKGETLGPILKNNSGKWRQSLTSMEVAAVETACKAAMIAGKYTKSDHRKFFPTLTGRTLGLAARFVAFVYRLKRASSNRRFMQQYREQS